MNKWIIVIIVFFILTGGVVYYWLNYEKPIKEEISRIVDLNIYSVDNIERYVPTGFIVSINGEKFYEGKTLRAGVTQVKVPLNSNYEVKNFNLEDQTFYVTKVKGSSSENDTRVKIKLIEPTPLKVEQLNEIDKEGNLIFNLTTEKEFRNLILCLEWTNNFIYVKTDYDLIPEKLKRFTTSDKCYKTHKTVNSSFEEQLNVSYKVWGSLEEDDYLKLYFIDSDNGVYTNEEQDVFANDLTYSVNINNI